MSNAIRELTNAMYAQGASLAEVSDAIDAARRARAQWGLIPARIWPTMPRLPVPCALSGTTSPLA